MFALCDAKHREIRKEKDCGAESKLYGLLSLRFYECLSNHDCPELHSSEFIELNPVQIKDLSKILWSVFRRLHSAVGGLVPYNLWLHNSLGARI